MKKTKLYTLFTITTIATLLLGCGNTNDSTEAQSKNKLQGKVVDTIIQGLYYTCGADQGFTDAQGLFGPCDPAATVDFSVGNILIASNIPRPADNIFTVNDMLGIPRTVNPTADVLDPVTKIGTFLLSIDNDGNATNNIVIDQRILTTLNTKLDAVKGAGLINISSITSAEVQTIVVDTATDVNASLNLNLQYKGIIEAATHITGTLDDVNTNIISAPSQAGATGAIGGGQI